MVLTADEMPGTYCPGASPLVSAVGAPLTNGDLCLWVRVVHNYGPDHSS